MCLRSFGVKGLDCATLRESSCNAANASKKFDALDRDEILTIKLKKL